MKEKQLKPSEKESDSKGENSFWHIFTNNDVVLQGSFSSEDETPSSNIDINSATTNEDLFDEIDTSSFECTDLDLIELSDNDIEVEIDQQEAASTLVIASEEPISSQRNNPRVRERIRISTYCMMLLKNPGKYDGWVTWLNREKGIFQILQPELVAKKWTEIKRNRVSIWRNFKRSIRSVTGDEENCHFQRVPNDYANVSHVVKFHERLRDQWMR